MSENNRLLVGLDLGEQFSQLSCFDRKLFEPMPIGRAVGEDGEREYEIATALTALPETGGWRFVNSDKEPDQGVVIRNILERVRTEETFTMGEYSFQSREVLKRFLVKLLSLLNEYYPDETIKRLVITIPEKDMLLHDILIDICAELGIGQDRLVIQNHKQSYMYYAVSQPKELWLNNVGLFEFDRSGLLYSQINIDRKTLPWIVGVTQKDLSDILDFSMIEDEEVDTEYAFENIAGTVLHKQMVTTIYVTGEGFEGKWAEEALKQLCNGRRVFRGQNIFTKGACYAARELSGEGKLEQCLFLDEDMISSNISIRLYHDAQMQEMVLAKAGSLWEEIDTKIDVIPDQEVEIRLTVQDVIRHETRTHMLSLSGFSGRENKMTRFTIRIRFTDRTTCVVTLKDNGFGEFCPSSHRIWERCITV